MREGLLIRLTARAGLSMALLVGATEALSQASPAVIATPLAVSEVVSVEGATKSQLYSAVLAWAGRSFRSAKAVVDIADANEGLFVAKPVFPFDRPTLAGSACTAGSVMYSVSVSVADGQLRYEIGPFFHEPHAIGCPIGGGCSYGEITDSVEPPRGRRCSIMGGDKKNWEALQKLTRAEIATVVLGLTGALAKNFPAKTEGVVGSEARR